MEDLGEVGVLTHPVAVAVDVDDMAVVQQAIDERSSHDLVAQDLAPLLEAQFPFLFGEVYVSLYREYTYERCMSKEGPRWAYRGPRVAANI
mgnify:CR=1 FL=1